MATKTVINKSTSVPQTIHRGISIIIDQDQEQKPQDIQLSSKRQCRQLQQISPELYNDTANDVEVSTPCEISPIFAAPTKTLIDINRNNVQVSCRYQPSDSQNSSDDDHHECNDENDEVEETGYTTITTTRNTAATFTHFNQADSTQDFGERGKLALAIVGEKPPAKEMDSTSKILVDGIHGILVGKSPIQTHLTVAPIDVGAGVSVTNKESTNRSNNGTAITNIDDVQHTKTKALKSSVKKTIIQCNVENADHNDEHDEWHYEESVHISDGAGDGDADDVGQLLCNGLRIVDTHRQQQSKLDDVLVASSKVSRLTKADCASAAKETFEYDADHESHVVKIQIKPSADRVNGSPKTDKQVTVVQVNENLFKNLEEPNNSKEETENIVKKSELNLNLVKMVQKPPTTSVSSGAQNGHSTTVTDLNISNPTYLYYTMSSGQFSPCDTLDSGTGSDLESNGTSGTPLTTQSPKGIIGMNGGSNGCKSTVITNGGTPKLEMHLKTTKIRVNNSPNKQNGEHQRAGSLTDSEESESSSLSCDSLHSTEYIRQSSASPSGKLSPKSGVHSKILNPFLPDSLLRDIRDRKYPTNDFEVKYGNQAPPDADATVETVNAQKLAEEVAEHAKFLQECNARDNESSDKRTSLPPSKTFILNNENGTFVDTKMNSMPRKYEADKYYNFHVNEHDNFHSFGHGNGNGNSANLHDDETSLLEYDTKLLHDDDFAGYKDIRCSSATSTIRSSKGTVRGVKNRVRNGIATFLQMQQPHVKNFLEKDVGKVVLYTTSMGIIRDTYAKCSNVKQILRTLLVKFEERDVFMSVEFQAEIKNRMHTDVIKVPQLFVEGQHIGDADSVERLNESGELRQLLKPYKSISTTYTCQTCGGYRLLPCPSCNGSKKSVHRNHFTAEFVALKCMNCDEVGLVKCHNC